LGARLGEGSARRVAQLRRAGHERGEGAVQANGPASSTDGPSTTRWWLTAKERESEGEGSGRGGKVPWARLDLL
jgi:hypothetical protein